MSKFIELTEAASGDTLVINSNHIIKFRTDKESGWTITNIRGKSGEVVVESLCEILDLLGDVDYDN